MQRDQQLQVGHPPPGRPCRPRPPCAQPTRPSWARRWPLWLAGELQPRTPGSCSAPAFQNRISLKGHGCGPDASCSSLPGHHGCPGATPAPQAPPKAVHSLSVSPCTAPKLGQQARGCEGRKGLRGGGWLQIGAEPQVLGAGGQYLQAWRWRSPRPSRQGLLWAYWTLEQPCQARPAELSPLHLCTRV